MLFSTRLRPRFPLSWTMTQVLGEMSALWNVSFRFRSPAVMCTPASPSLRASDGLSTRNSISKLGSRISSRTLITSSSWQMARHLIGEPGREGARRTAGPSAEKTIIRLSAGHWSDHYSLATCRTPGVACPAMTRYWCLSAAMLLGAATASVSAAPPGVDSPEPVIRAFYSALLKGDADGYHKAIVEDPRAERFLMKAPPDADKAREVDMESQTFTMRQLQPFRLKGKEATPADGKYPVGTTTRYLASSPASLTVISVVRAADGWKVDMRWWDAIADLMQKDVQNGTPEYAVKSLMA